MLIGELLLKRNNLDLARVDHRNFSTLREYLDANKAQLYHDAETRLEQALGRLSLTEATSLQRLAATFRRGDLLEELGKIPA
jgi:hypothetical protein